MPINSDFTDHVVEYIRGEGSPRVLFPPHDFSLVGQGFPDDWRVLLEADLDSRAVFQNLWANVGKILPKTFMAVESSLQGIIGLETKRYPASLMYIFTKNGRFFAHRGFSPAYSLPDICEKLPVDFLDFYSIHDGWVDFYSGDAGLLPFREWQVIGHKDGICEGFLQVFRHGGSALGFDLDEAPPEAFAIYSDGGVERVEDFWSEIDGWMFRNFKNKDSRE